MFQIDQMLAWLTSGYTRWPDKAGPSWRHFGRAFDRLIVANVYVLQSFGIYKVSVGVVSDHRGQ